MDVQAPDLSSYNLCNAEEKLEAERIYGMYTPSSRENVDDILRLEKLYMERLSKVKAGVDTDWLAKPLRNGVGHKHSLMIELGDKNIQLVANVSYNDVVGVMKGSDRTNVAGSVFASYRNNKFKFRNELSVNMNKSNDSPYGSFAEYSKLNPYWSPVDEYGQIAKNAGDEEAFYGNPLYNATLNTKDETAYTEIRDNFSMDWSISKAFRAVGSFSFTRQESGSDVFYPASHTKFAKYDENGMSDRKGEYTKGDGSSQTVSVQAGLNFNKTFGEHLLFANVTWNMSTARTISTTTVAEGFGNDYMDDISFATKYQKDGSPSGSNSRSREIGVIGAINYSFADRYLFDASLRKSASSVYGSDSHWGTFWSLGAGWNVHHEKFLEGNAWIKQFKLRASMGYTGTQNVDPSQSRARYEYYDYVYGDKIGAQLVALPNDKLKWQRNMDYNLGVDVTLKRFLTLRADYYIQRTDDLLSNISLPPSTGFLTYTENLGKIENRGYELAVSVTPWRDDERQAYVTLSATALHNKNKIKKIYDIFKNSNDEQNSSLDGSYDYNDGQPGDTEVLEKYLNKFTKPATLYYEGCSMTAIWGVRSLGIDPATGQEMFLTKDGRSTYTWSSADQVVIGDLSLIHI